MASILASTTQCIDHSTLSLQDPVFTDLAVVNGDNAVSSLGRVVIISNLDCTGGRWQPLLLGLLIYLEDMGHCGIHGSLSGEEARQLSLDGCVLHAKVISSCSLTPWFQAGQIFVQLWTLNIL